MRFMVIVKATKDSEAGKMPSEEMLGAMAKFNEEMVKAGIMLDGAGLQASQKGARIRFCDIEPTTLGLDPAHLETLLDETTRAVVPIHYAGVACDIDGIVEVLARWPRAELVEDNAHGLFGRLRDRPLGSFGRFTRPRRFGRIDTRRHGRGRLALGRDGARRGKIRARQARRHDLWRGSEASRTESRAARWAG